jgi:repressor LexA
MLPLTARQSQVLLFIQEFMQDEGFPPTRADIAKGLGFRSVNAAEDHLKALVRKQAIEILSGTSRGIRLLGDAAETGLPVIGRVAAGRPILAEQHIQRHYQVDAHLFRPRAHYLLRVKGQSMRDAGILDADLLAVHRQPTAENGEIVVARIDDEVTVKRFRRRGNTVRLMPENEAFSPVVVDLRREALTIEGIGVGVIRNRRNL